MLLLKATKRAGRGTDAFRKEQIEENRAILKSKEDEKMLGPHKLPKYPQKADCEWMVRGGKGLLMSSSFLRSW